MKTTTTLIALFLTSITFGQLTGTSEPSTIACPLIVTSPNWYPKPDELLIKCPQVKVGIGTASAFDKLHIATRDDEGIAFVPTATDQRSRIQFLDQSKVLNWDITAYNNFHGGYGNILEINSHKGGKFWLNQATMIIGNGFNFDACTDSSDYKLFVRKGIRTERIKVDVAAGVWADFVFTPDYSLMPLSNLENYIKVNKHLPNVPSAQEIEKTGLDVAATDALLLQKIEELTLYIIELEKRMNAQQELIDTMINK